MFKSGSVAADGEIAAPGQESTGPAVESTGPAVAALTPPATPEPTQRGKEKLEVPSAKKGTNCLLYTSPSPRD
eukprot:14421371-Alexandrium_andersonii.AAC.1